MHPPGAEHVLVRYGDLTTKSASVAGGMRNDLAAHLRSLLEERGLAAELDVRHARTFLRTDAADVEAVARAAADTFGVVSASPALRVEPTQEAIEAALAETASQHYDGGRFAVAANRAYGGHPFTSEDVEQSGGAAVWEAAEASGVEPVVDLEDPDLRFEVEIRENDAYVFLDRVDGPGGFPFGSQAPMVALISGGIDSPVAAYEMLARGSPVIPVYLDLGDYGGPDHEARALETVRRLAWYAPDHDWSLLRVPAGESVAAIADELGSGRMLAFRRYMFAVADAIAEERGAVGIVSGEAIGQKSSQTASNLRATSAAVERPIHRPLLCADKHDITQCARVIGTFYESTIPAGCNRFAPDHPRTECSLAAIRDDEPDDLFEWARADAAHATATDVEPVEPERQY